VEAADVVIVNKIDLYTEPELAETRRELRRIHPDVVLYETEHCDVDFALFGPAEDRSMTGELALCADPAYARAEVRIDRPVDWPRLRGAIDEARGVLYRVKGFVPVAGRLVYADLSPSGWSEERASGRAAEPGLVLIARGDAEADLRALARRIEAGDFAA
jgi:G3E family GTPase